MHPRVVGNAVIIFILVDKRITKGVHFVKI
jgi:hypothetical protein